MNQEAVETYLNDGLLMVFVAPVDPSLRRDVMDCSLYTQLAAARQFSKFTDYRDWQTTLIKALAAFGWLRLDLADKQGTSGETLAIAEVLSELLPDALSDWRGERLDNLLASLFQAPGNDVAAAIIERCVEVTAPQTDTRNAIQAHAEPLSSVVLQIGFVLPTREMVLLCVAFETLETVDANPFAQRLMNSHLAGDFRAFAFVGVLDDLRYSPFRQRIDKALAEKRAALCFPCKAFPVTAEQS